MKASEILKRRKRRRKWSIAAQILTIALAGISGMVWQAVEREIFAFSESTVIFWFVLSNISAFIVGIWNLVTSLRLNNRIKTEDDVRKTLINISFDIQLETKLPMEEVGMSVWAVYSPWWRKLLRKPAVLERKMRHRLSPFPTATDMVWNNHKGVIGECWTKNEVIFQSWFSEQEKLSGKKTLSNSQWKKRVQKNWGFGQDEYLTMVRKYCFVMAFPITDEAGTFLGCLSIDFPSPHDIAEDTAKFDFSDETNSIIQMVKSVDSRRLRKNVALGIDTLKEILE